MEELSENAIPVKMPDNCGKTERPRGALLQLRIGVMDILRSIDGRR